MASEVEICNRALQKLGAERIADLIEATRNARSCNACYSVLRDSELRAHPWSFAITRIQLAADAAEPAFGKARSFTLPAACLRLLPPYPEMNFNSRDWVVEGRQIFTNESAPLDLRFIQRVTDPNMMDALFREALSSRMAEELAEELTQSNSKKAEAKDSYKNSIRLAKRTNAIENIPAAPATDEWLTIRN